MNDVFNIALQQFRDSIVIKFQLYNSLFTSLPFHRIEKTGILLSLLFITVKKVMQKNKALPRSLKILAGIQAIKVRVKKMICCFVCAVCRKAGSFI